MSRYFFHIFNGDGPARDEEGTDLPSDSRARKHAIEGIRSILAEETIKGEIDLSGRIEVTDCQGNLLFVVPYRDALSITGAAN